MIKVYQAIKCSDGRKEHDYLFGRLVKEMTWNGGLLCLEVIGPYSYSQLDDSNSMVDETWNYKKSDCRLIITGSYE